MQNNSINSQTDIANVTVVTEENQIIVPQPITNVIEVNNPGPQGPVGPQGVAGPSEPFVNIGGGVYATTSSIQVSGSFLVSGSSTFTNIGPAIFSGSANIVGATTMSSAVVTGNVQVLGTASINVLQISTTINSTGSNILGDAPNDTQTLYGSVIVPTGSLTVSGIVSSGNSLNTGGGSTVQGELRSYQLSTVPLWLSLQTTTGKSGLFRSNTDYILYYDTSTGDTVLNSSFGGAALKFNLQNSEKMRILSNGNIGIGITTPSSSLHIKGTTTSSLSSSLLVQDSNASASFIVRDDGRVGIGTNNPQALLDLYGTSFPQIWIRDNSGVIANLYAAGSVAIVGSVSNHPVCIRTNNNNSVMIWTNNGMSIGGSYINAVAPANGLIVQGNTGIGTNNPSASLHIKGATTSSLSSSLLVQDSGSIYSFRIKDNGDVAFNSNYITINGYDTTINSGNGVAVNGAAFIPGYIYRSGTTSGFLTIANDSTVASSIILYGSTHATLPNIIRVTAPSGIQITGSLQISGSGAGAEVFLVSPNGAPTVGIKADSVLTDYAGLYVGSKPIIRSKNANPVFFNIQDNINFADNNNTRSTMNSAGSLGLGITSASDITSRLRVRGTGTTSATTALRVENTNASASLVVLDNGFVGIGTGSAEYNLDVNGTARIGGSGGSAQLYIKGLSGTGQYLYFDNGSVANGIWTMVGSTVFAFDSATTRIWRISPSAQMTINGNTNDSSAQFQVESTTRGFLPPRTSATSLISSPAQGLITYVTGSNDGLYYYNNNSQVGWHKVLTNTGSQSITGSLSISGTSILQGAVAINSTNISTGYALFVNGVIGASSLTLTQNLTMGENFAISNNGSQTIDIDANNDTTNAVFRVTANGTANELFRVNETGSFGIGTITPSARLHISGSSNSGLLEIDSPAVNNILYVSGSGNVGIGTTTPTQKLHVSGGNAFVNGTIYFGDGSHYLTTDNSTYALFSSNRNLQLGRSGVAALTVVSTGNVLIGTSTTDAGFKLDVNGNAKIKGSGTTSATTALRVENTNASASMVVLDNGNVGIGTSSPAYLLDITGSDSLINISPQASGNAIVINNNGFIKWENASLDTYLRCSNGFNLSDNGFNSKFNIAFGGLSSINTGQNFSFQSGNVLVGTTTDVGYKLNVSGSVNVSNILTLTPQSPLPSGVATGSFAVSSSVPPKPYFYDGTTWNALY